MRTFYVYALLDPRKPGPWEVDLPRGQLVEFPFLPFYIGKGKGTRITHHVRAVKLGRPVKNGKMATIKAVLTKGLEVIEHQVFKDLRETVAFELERALIKSIGRKDLGIGPLMNYCDGGEGASGAVRSKEYRMQMSELLKGRPKAYAVSEATRRLLAEHRTGTRTSETTRALLSAVHTGKVLEVAHIEKTRVANLGKVRSAAHKENYRKAAEARPVLTCPRCGVVSKGPVLKRHHFNNCTTDKSLVQNGKVVKPIVGIRKGSATYNAVLNESIVRKIREVDHPSGMSQKDIARLYGVAPSKISRIISRKVWAHV